MQDRRLRRVEELIRQKIASTLLRDLQDPRLGFVTVTKVKVDKELQHCEVFWSVLGDEKDRAVHERLLSHAAGYVQREVAAILETRTMPRVHFVFDESIAGAMRIDGLIKRLKAEREAREASLPTPPPEPNDPAKPPTG